MNRTLYTIIFYLLSPVIWGYLLLRGTRAAEYREGYRQRLGMLPKDIYPGGILIHCASVGEMRAAAPLLKRLFSDHAGLPITVTTTTPTGKKAVSELFGNSVQQCYLPLDWPGACRRFLKRLNPAKVILMETELWPNFLAACQQQKIPVLLANARLSDKSCEKYLKYPKIADELMASLTKIAAQYDSDKQNFLRLGAAEEQVELVGSIKFDLTISDELQKQQVALKSNWAKKRPVWLAASIHPAEFDDILKTHQALLKSIPELLLVAVPRHPEKFAELKSLCQQQELSFISRSDGCKPDAQTQVVVGDTMGEMLLFCGLADVAYVGGSLIERGGHNPLEPVACGTPVLMGPHYYNFADVGRILLDQQVMLLVSSRKQLEQKLENILRQPAELEAMSQRAEAIFLQNRGCVEKLLNLIACLKN